VNVDVPGEGKESYAPPHSGTFQTLRGKKGKNGLTTVTGAKRKRGGGGPETEGYLVQVPGEEEETMCPPHLLRNDEKRTKRKRRGGGFYPQESPKTMVKETSVKFSLGGLVLR